MSKKGFTTMELLAVVIVLAILSLVTTSVVTVVIENADKAAAKDSAHGYVEALNMEIMESNYSSKKLIKSGYYYAQYFEELGLSVGGAAPKEDSWVYIKDGEVKKYSLKFKKYSATNLDDEVVVDKTISEHDICFKLDVKYKNLYNYGDSYSCYVGDGKVRTFYLLEDGDSELSTGKTSKGKLSLIMNRNFVGIMNRTNALEFLKNINNKWNLVETYLPTFEQIVNAGGKATETSSANYKIKLDNEFLYENIDCEECNEKLDEDFYENVEFSNNNSKGYWTDTLIPWSEPGWLWVVGYDDAGYNMWHFSPTGTIGFRPVIVIDK